MDSQTSIALDRGKSKAQITLSTIHTPVLSVYQAIYNDRERRAAQDAVFEIFARMGSDMLLWLILLGLLLQTSAKSKKKKCSLKGGGYYGYELSRPVELDTGDELDWFNSAGELVLLKQGDSPSGTFDDVPEYKGCRKLCEKNNDCIAWEAKVYRVGGPGMVGRYCALFSEIYGKKLKKTRCYYASCSHGAGKCKGG